MKLTGLAPADGAMLHDGIPLSDAQKGIAGNVIRDASGVPVEWTLLRIGGNELVKNGEKGVLALSAEDMRSILAYQAEKGELIPVDSNHYLHELANRKGLEESEVLRLLPSGVAAMGYGSLALSGDELRFRVQWTPTAYELMKEKIFKYFSPALRGLAQPPLRVTSVAMENEPAINHLDALAASSRKDRNGNNTPRKDVRMNRLEKALGRLLGRDSIALESETKEDETDKIACEIEEKASLIEQVKTLLGLGTDAGIEEIVAALKAETEKASSADDKQAKLDEIAACAEKKSHAEQVGRGLREGKLADCDLAYADSLDSKALSAYLDHAGVKVPQGKITPGVRKSGDSAALSADEEKTIRDMRLDREAYINMKKGI